MAKETRLEAMRRAVLRDWRGADDPSHPDERLHLPKEFLAAILRQAGATEGIDEERLRGMWKEVAGDFVAGHATPVSLKGGCLTLHVLQPAMRCGNGLATLSVASSHEPAERNRLRSRAAVLHRLDRF